MGKHKPRRTKISDASRAISAKELNKNYPLNRKGQPRTD